MDLHFDFFIMKSETSHDGDMPIHGMLEMASALELNLEAALHKLCSLTVGEGSVYHATPSIDAGGQSDPESVKVGVVKQRLHRARRQRSESFMREVFDRHATKTTDCPDGELRDDQFEVALQDLGVSRDLKASLVADGSSRVDYEKWKAAVAVPSPVDAWARRGPWWQIVADAMPSQVGTDEDPLRSVSRLTVEDVDAVCCVVAKEVSRELREQISNLARAFEQLDRRREDIDAGGASKFQTYKAHAGNVDDYHKGLGSRIGSPHTKFFEAMQAEHCSKAGSEYEFETPNYHFVTTAAQEWRIVVEGAKCPEQNLKHGRDIKDLNTLIQLGKDQGNLRKEEVIAVVLYTGPMYFPYGAVLRRHPEAAFNIFNRGGNLFATTLHVLASAVQKLSRQVRIPEGRLLYRGLGGLMELPDSFFKADALGRSGFSEWSFMSTTENKQVAVQYSGTAEKRPAPTVLVVSTGAIDRGACIKDYSQHPQEVEYLYPPCSFLQRTGDDYLECTEQGPVRIITVRINSNNMTRTVEELLEEKKKMHIASFEYCLEEMHRNMLLRKEAFDLRIAQDVSGLMMFGIRSLDSFVAFIGRLALVFLNKHKKVDAEEYLEDQTYRALVTEMLDAKRFAESMLELYLADPSQTMKVLQTFSLRMAHRMYISFLRKQLASYDLDSDSTKQLAIHLCKVQGLIRASVDEKNEMDESRMVQGSADGWERDKLWLLQRAGANVNADSHGRVAAPELTPLMAASLGGHTSTVKVLVDLGADVSIESVSGCTAIGFAAIGGCAETVKALVGLGAAVEKTNSQTTALILAALGGFSAVVRTLVELGADVNRVQDDGLTALMNAAMTGHTDTVQVLVELGAAVDHGVDNPEGGEMNGMTALIFAVSAGHMSVVKKLAELRADVNHSTKGGQTPVLFAASRGHAEVVRVLADLGADVNHSTPSGHTAVMLAAFGGHTAAVRLLAELGADVCKADQRGISVAWMVARNGGHTDTMQALVELGANPENRAY